MRPSRVVIALGCAVCALFAQNPTAIVVGTVRDSAGAAIDGATVKVRNIDTGAGFELKSNVNGEFTAANLPAGQYEAIVSHEGFRTLRRTGLELHIDQTARLELRLELGAILESVEVTATLPLVNTESAAMGEAIGSA